MLYGNSMRSTIAHLLIVLLVAVFAIGVPLSAQAECAACEDCTAATAGKADAPCSQKGLACQMAQSCAGALQKMPAQAYVGPSQTAREVAFAGTSAIVIKFAEPAPETAPPRL